MLTEKVMKISSFKIFILIMLLVVMGLAYDLDRKKKEEELRNQERQQIQKFKDDSIRKRAIELGADYGWLKKLEEASNKNYNLMSYQIEEIFVINKPILFFGYIKDIKKSTNEYKLEIKRAKYGPFIVGEIEFLITCGTQVTEKFIKYMEENRNEFFLLKSVAVIAKLDSVIAEKRVKEGIDTEAKIVLGNCLDLIPSTENYLFKL